MSFTIKPINLSNSGKDNRLHVFKTCTKCVKERPPEGGVDLAPNKWVCASCWAMRRYKRT